APAPASSARAGRPAPQTTAARRSPTAGTRAPSALTSVPVADQRAPLPFASLGQPRPDHHRDRDRELDHRDQHHRQRRQLPARIDEEPRVGTKQQRDRPEHQLDRQQRDHQRAPQQRAAEPHAKQREREIEVVGDRQQHHALVSDSPTRTASPSTAAITAARASSATSSAGITNSLPSWISSASPSAKRDLGGSGEPSWTTCR